METTSRLRMSDAGTHSALPAGDERIGKRAQTVCFGEGILEFLIPKISLYLSTQGVPCCSSVDWDSSRLLYFLFHLRRFMETFHVPGTVSGFGIFYLVFKHPLPMVIIIIYPIIYPIIIIIIISLYL